MIIGEEIIKMFEGKHGKTVAFKSKVQEANSLEEGTRLATESLSIKNIIIDNGGRRSEIDRRAFQYAIHLPEKRFVEDRRIRLDRRGGVERRTAKRSEGDRRQYFTA